MGKFVIALVAVVAIALSLGACGTSEDDLLVSDYCEYGARSEAQFEGCKDHVTAEQVRARNTPAARWAKHGGYCGTDAGPMCFDREESELVASRSSDPDIPHFSPAACEQKYQELSDRRAAAGWGHLKGY
jgi:hypothetical protein